MPRLSGRSRSASGLAPRRLAFDVLLAVETRQAYSDVALGHALEESDLRGPDRALATRLVYGVLTWQRRLDWIADHWTRPRSAELDPEVRLILRLALFQVAFLDRVPAFAAVDTAVELARRVVRRASGFVNGVLRRGLREGLPEPSNDGSPDALGLRWSHPSWLVERWIEELGSDGIEALLAANNEPAPVVVRAIDPPESGELAELARLGCRAAPCSYAQGAFRIEGDPPEGFFRGGTGFVAQSEASQLIPSLVGAEPGDVLLDACAAPGGKSMQLESALRGSGLVVAIDTSASGIRRVGTIAQNLEGNRLVGVRADASLPPFGPETFDRILVDAPCSGVGTLRPHPEIRWRVTPERVNELSRLQEALLGASARIVRRGGTLVYSTCSLLRRENENVIARFLASARDEFEVIDPSKMMSPPARTLVRENALRTFPHAHDTDGFYAVALRRRGASLR